MAKSIKQLKKHTNSLQSMMSMNANENNQPEVGKYLTEFCYTDRHSYLITEVDGNSFKTKMVDHTSSITGNFGLIL
jgi:very-short-patch-repair endonuclease